MFGSEVLGLVDGMAFLYLLLTLVCSVLSELVSHWRGSRAKTLRDGLKQFLHDATGDFTKNLYEHKLITPLNFGRLPPYIPTGHFVDAFLDTCQKHSPAGDIKEIVDLLVGNPPDYKSGDVRKRVEDWFDDCTAALRLRYRRSVMTLITVLASFITILANADTIMIYNSLWTDATVRAGVVSAIHEKTSNGDTPKEIGETIDVVKQKVEELKILGWTLDENKRRSMPRTLADVFFKLIGLGLTILAVAGGAPFWFDLFRNLINPNVGRLDERSLADELELRIRERKD